MRRVRVICVLLPVCLWLAGCGGDPGFPNRIQPAIGPDGITTLRKGNGAEPQTLDPAKATGVPAANILRDLYEGLVIYAPDGHVIPGDAKSWRISADGKTYTFHLRKNAKWSNGAPVTAQDYVFSLRRAVAPSTASPYADIHAPIVNATAIIDGKKPPASLGVAALDAHTLQIKLHAPTPFFLKTLAHSSSDPVYPPAVKKWGDAFTQPQHAVTNGAYELVSWRVNDKIVLRRNPHYWDNEDTAIDRVEYYPITDANSELARYQAGGLDWTSGVPTAKLDTVKKHIPGQYHAVPTLSVFYFGLNVTRPPFQGRRKLRMALSMALDREIITDKILRGNEIPAYSWVPTALQGYRSVRYAWAGLSDKARKARARKLYHEAGYSEEHPLKANLLYVSGEGGKRMAIVAAAMWRKVLGAEINTRSQEWKVYLQTIHSRRNTQIFYVGWIGDYEDPNTFFSIMKTHSAQNESGYHSAVYDRAVSASQHMPSGPKRTRLMHVAEATLLHDSPIIPLYFGSAHHLIKPYVKGFVGNPLGAYYSKDMNIVPASAGGR
ncbi:peptide ABC transporter substrate-binding protein [Salinisphaera sp.]|uniref:peptide ABC transporter substrate-binding protein n=1 Tax=Salinisphaera sp. TaxID=1914330 RepID=UPI002D79C371|nr:peptide ABC transporter substrate-binding protein [Salinisphaera sp.]HET7313365.1 peptide ABC transporter substrate-binding protein [Salinisphaera sp.]